MTSHIGWASEDARIASNAALGIEAGLMELERNLQSRENHFASQVARVDRLILAMRAVLLDVGIIFSHSHQAFRTLEAWSGTLMLVSSTFRRFRVISGVGQAFSVLPSTRLLHKL